MDKNVEIIGKYDLKEKIIGKIKKTEQDIKKSIFKYRYILIYVLLVFVILFTFAKIIKTSTNFYGNDVAYKWDKVLSYDDMYYSRKIYTENPQYTEISYTLIKHPFMSVIGQGITKIENLFFDNTQKADHYFHIVVFQIVINIIGIFYLYRILKEQYNLREKWCFLLLTIYEFATVTLLGTFLIESFLLSSTLLIMSYFYLSKQKLIQSIILGILVTGVTITNSVAFGIMAIILLKNKKNILKVGGFCLLGFLFISLFLPYRDYLYKNFFTGAYENLTVFSENSSVDIRTFFKMIFFYLLSSPIFFINNIHTKIDGFDYFKFDLFSGKIIILTTILFFIFIIYNVVKNIKDRNMLAALGVFIYNMFIHVILKFGLYEGTIYGLHFLFAEILMFALGFKIENKIIRRTFICFSIILLLVEIRYNMNGMLNLLLLFKDWK